MDIDMTMTNNDFYPELLDKINVRLRSGSRRGFLRVIVAHERHRHLARVHDVCRRNGRTEKAVDDVSRLVGRRPPRADDDHAAAASAGAVGSPRLRGSLARRRQRDRDPPRRRRLGRRRRSSRLRRRPPPHPRGQRPLCRGRRRGN